MKSLLTLGILLALLVAPSLSMAHPWKIDPEHSTIGFKVRHMMIANVKGEFSSYTGTIDIDEKDITKSSAKVTIDTASIDTRIAKRDEHLRSADFFDVATYPAMTFVSKKVRKISIDQLAITGDLTIRGITKEVVLDVSNFTPPVLDLSKKIRRGAAAVTKINRKDFGLTWNKVMETGGVAVGDEVTIMLEIEMIRQ